MNRNTRFAALALLSLLGSAAIAQDDLQTSTWATPSTLSRVDAKEATDAGFRNAARTTTSYTVVAVANPTLSRTQVAAEAREAMRLGLVPVTEANAGRRASPAEAEQIRQAGLRAVNTEIATK